MTVTRNVPGGARAGSRAGSTVLLLARVCRVPPALAVLTAGAAVVAWLGTTFAGSAYAYVPSAAPAVTAAAITAGLVGATLAVPRLEALEVTAHRSLVPLRLAVAGVALLAAVVLAAVATTAVGVPWLAWPFARNALLMTGVTLGTAALTPGRYAASVALVYVVACHGASAGSKPWDLLLAAPSAATDAAAVAIGVVGGTAFVLRGTRPAPPLDDLA